MDLDEESMAMRPTTEVAPLQLPCATPMIAERYCMGRLLGTGGMADVFLADDLHLERTVAIKVLHDVHAIDSSGFERFRREAIALATIASPHVARIHDAKLEGERPYLVIEYIDGVTVDEEVTRAGPLESARVEAIVSQILDGLVEIHARGLVHRDIKPSNVIVAPNGRAVLIDLGIAFDRRRSPLTAPGMAAGTPGFFAPEIEPAPASDIYQVGLLMVFMLTGVDRAGREAAIDLDGVVGTVPLHLAAVLRRALAVDPAQRYGSAQSMMADLRDSRSFTASQLTAAADDRQDAREQRLTTKIAPADLLGLLVDAGPRPMSGSDESARRTMTATPAGYLTRCPPSELRRRRYRVRMPSIQVTTTELDIVMDTASSWTVSLALLSIVAVATALFVLYVGHVPPQTTAPLGHSVVPPLQFDRAHTAPGSQRTMHSPDPGHATLQSP